MVLLVFGTLVTRAPPDFWVSDAHFVDYDFRHYVDYDSFYNFAADGFRSYGLNHYPSSTTTMCWTTGRVFGHRPRSATRRCRRINCRHAADHEEFNIPTASFACDGYDCIVLVLHLLTAVSASFVGFSPDGIADSGTDASTRSR